MPENSFFNSIKIFFTSMKVTVFFLFLLAIISIIGTIIPQQQTSEFYQTNYSIMLYKVIISTGLDNLYNSLIYRIILAILGVNILICNTEHFLKRLKKPAISLPFKTYENERFQKFSFSFPIEETFEKIKKQLKNFKVKEESDKDGKIYLYAEQGQIKFWGVFLVHISILIIFTGAVYGGFKGFKDQAFLMESVENRDIYPEKNNGFYVKLKEFRLEVNEDRSIKDYFSDLEVLDNGKKVCEKTIEVNNPLEYKGVTFYQSGWGLLGFQLGITLPDGEKDYCQIPLDESGNIIPGKNFFVLPEKWIIKVDEFYPDVQFREGKVENISSLPVNPAIYLLISEDFIEKHKKGEEPEWKELGWLSSGKDIKYKGFNISYDKTLEYSILQVKKDPGRPLVYFGCILIMVGLPAAFYIHHRVLRICIFTKSPGETSVYAGFSGRKEEGEDIYINSIIKI